MMRSKIIKNSNLQRDEKVTFHFDPLPNRLCFLADCMFPGKPICIDVLDAGHQVGTLSVGCLFTLYKGLPGYDILDCSRRSCCIWYVISIGAFHSSIKTQTKKT